MRAVCLVAIVVAVVAMPHGRHVAGAADDDALMAGEHTSSRAIKARLAMLEGKKDKASMLSSCVSDPRNW